MRAVDLGSYRNIVVLTGAGTSVASGLRPFRGPGGVWTDQPDEMDVATASTLAVDPDRVWRLLGPLRAAIAAAEPNAAHRALADFEARATARGISFLVVTQNIDGLHQRAGSREVVEIHGTLARTRCTRCERPPFADDETHELGTPVCDACGAPLRPDIVLFGEHVDVDAEHRVKRALRDCDLFIAIGTSGTVSPASSYVRWAEVNGAHTIFVNMEPMNPPNPAFRDVFLGRAEDVVPRLFAATRS